MRDGRRVRHIASLLAVPPVAELRPCPRQEHLASRRRASHHLCCGTRSPSGRGCRGRAAILANIRVTTEAKDEGGASSTRSLTRDTPRGEWCLDELQELARTTAEAAGMLTERTVRVMLDVTVPEPDEPSRLDGWPDLTASRTPSRCGTPWWPLSPCAVTGSCCVVGSTTRTHHETSSVMGGRVVKPTPRLTPQAAAERPPERSHAETRPQDMPLATATVESLEKGWALSGSSDRRGDEQPASPCDRDRR